MVTKEDAVKLLLAVGLNQEANELNAWRDVNGNNWGWDGWIRGTHPHVIAVIWPDE